MAPSNARHGAAMATALFGKDALIELVQCAKQSNGYDCGVYVARFAMEVLQDLLADDDQVACNFDRAKSWRVAVAL
eukprot:2297905-Pyramimonas_sp.AAC.1